MAAKETGPETASSGVEQLIERLRDQGVQQGRAKADAIVEHATTQAEALLAEAKAKAARIVDEAREQARQLDEAGTEALRIATRDTILRFQQELMDHLNERVRRLVTEEMENRELLGRILVEVAGDAARSAGAHDAEAIDVLLPARVLGVEQLKGDSEALASELTQLAKSVAATTWREGVTFKALAPDASGIRVRVKGKDLDVELTPEAVAEILIEHMQPRFRALMQGIIQ